MKKNIFFLLLFISSILKSQSTFRHTVTNSNTQGHITILDHPELNGNPNAIIFVMPYFNDREGTNYNKNVGVWYNGSRWTIFNQNIKEMMPTNSVLTFNVLIAPSNNPNVFTHTCTKENTGATGGTFSNSSWINNTATNNNPNALLLVTQNWKGIYNDNTPVVSYGGGKWYVSNTISSPNDLGVKKEKDMPVGAAFNIMVINKGQVPGFSDAMGFMHTATKANLRASNATFIDNPNFKHSKDVMLFATNNWGWGYSTITEQTAGPNNDSNIEAWFNTNFTNGCAIYNTKPNTPIVIGAKFNVVVIPKSGNCNLIFYERTDFQGRSVCFNSSTDNPNIPFTVQSIKVASGLIAEFTYNCRGEFPPTEAFVNQYPDVNFSDICNIKLSRIISTQNVNIPDFTEGCPTNHVAGDGEFAGRGPNLFCRTTLNLQNNQLNLNVWFEAREDGFPTPAPQTPPTNIDRRIDYVYETWNTAIFTAPIGQRIVIPYGVSKESQANFRSRPAGDEPGGIFGACNEGQLHINGRDFQITGTLAREMQIVGDTGSYDIKNNCRCDTKIKLIRFNPVTAYLISR